jgi:hypothetical protein
MLFPYTSCFACWIAVWINGSSSEVGWADLYSILVAILSLLHNIIVFLNNYLEGDAYQIFIVTPFSCGYIALWTKTVYPHIFLIYGMRGSGSNHP